MTAVLAVALFAPALVLPVARLAPTAAAARRWSSAGALALAAIWFVLLLGDDTATLGRFGAGAAPAAVGTWLLVAALTWPTQRLPIATGAVAAGVAVGGVSLLTGGGEASDAAGAIAIAATVAMLGARAEDDGGLAPAVVGVLGAAALALGVARDGVVLATLGSAAVAACAAARPRRVGSVLLPAAIFLGVTSGGGDRVAVLLALAGCALAARPGVALALWAVAAAAAGAPTAGLLLGASAVLTTVAVHPAVAVVALPGAAALAAALADHGTRSSVLLAAIAAVTVARLWQPADDARPGLPSRPTLAALGAGAWLLVAPQTWAWVGTTELPSWRSGIVVAAVGAVVGAFLVASFTDGPFVLPPVDTPDPAYRVGDPRWAARVAPVALGVLGICGVALLASSMS